MQGLNPAPHFTAMQPSSLLTSRQPCRKLQLSFLSWRTYCHHAGTRSRSSEGPCMQQQGNPQVPVGFFSTSVNCHAPLQISSTCKVWLAHPAECTRWQHMHLLEPETLQATVIFKSSRLPTWRYGGCVSIERITNWCRSISTLAGGV